MTAFDTFQAAWQRADHLDASHAFLAANATAVLQPDELLRAEWAARVSALDLYIHEIVIQELLATIAKTRPAATGFQKFQLGCDLILQAPAGGPGFLSAADLAIRAKLERMTFQYPEDIADAIRHISDIELWNEIALHQGATAVTKAALAKSTKLQLTQIVSRRNKIVHEADLQPAVPRVPWPISSADLVTVRGFIEGIVKSVHALL
jgi:hypothetical protein